MAKKKYSSLRVYADDLPVINRYAELLSWSQSELIHFIRGQIEKQVPELMQYVDIERLKRVYKTDELIRGEKNG